ncbi:MAG: hypothetical protein CL610_06115 [Anaerolineaceae bacterium]|nr:hypothetical protein [Anaerolineaceae bacterium]
MTLSDTTIEWLRPLTWVDPSDYVDILNTGAKRDAGEEKWAVRREKILDLLADTEKRPTDTGAMLKGFTAAHNAADPDRPLTARQRQAVEVRSAALHVRGIQRPMEIYIYVGHELGITPQAAYQLLRRADLRLEAKTFTGADSFAYIVERDDPNRERRIQRIIATLDHECPGAGFDYCYCTKNEHYRVPGGREFCPACYDVWCKQRSRADWPAWLDYRNSEIRADTRRRAIEVLDYAELRTLDYSRMRS